MVCIASSLHTPVDGAAALLVDLTVALQSCLEAGVCPQPLQLAADVSVGEAVYVDDKAGPRILYPHLHSHKCCVSDIPPG